MNELVLKLKKYFFENTEDLQDVVVQINGYNGSLEFLDFLEMEMIDEVLSECLPSEILMNAFHGQFNPHEDYFSIDVYGHLVSYTEYEFKKELLDYLDEILDQLFEVEEYIDLPEGVRAILDEAPEIDL